jgi:hypothetical protein
LQYIDYVQILQDFIRAERLSDWNLHLTSLAQMLNLFAATGHRNYAKSARLYLQMMLNLRETHPWLHEQLSVNSLHAVRRTDRYWAGLWTDLVIEQVMMRSVKSRGGLTHGRGMSESVRLMWVKSMHRCAAVHSAIASLTGSDNAATDVQHVECGKARRRRDGDDLKKMLAFFQDRNPFKYIDGRLRSLSSGIVASESDEIDCDNAEDAGKLVMSSMDNIPYDSVKIKKASQVKTLADVTTKVFGCKKKYPLDSLALFNRLLAIAQRNADMDAYFKFELTAYPTALFTDSASLRKTNKAVI